jgi:hypothetical protein
MSGHQVKNYPETVVLKSDHYWYIIEAAEGLMPDEDQRISVEDFFANVPVPATFQANITASFISCQNTHLQFATSKYTPANSSVTFGPSGSIAYDLNYVYIQVSPGVVGRAQLDFTF